MVVTDGHGNIKEQRSLNVINGYNWREALIALARENKQTEQEWNKDAQKAYQDAHAAYIAAVIGELVKMAQKYPNLLISLENLQKDFTKHRPEFEQAVYSQLINAIVNKFGLLIIKNIDPNQHGGVQKPLQLTSQYRTGKFEGVQNGITWLVPPEYTSKIDPATGFVNIQKLTYSTIKEAKSILHGMFKCVKWNDKEQMFELDIYFSDKSKASRKKWALCTTNEKRYYYNRRLKCHQELDVTEELKNLLREFNVSYQDGRNIIGDILKLQKGSGVFFKKFMWLYNCLASMRYFNPNTKEDYIMSPVRSSDGMFFDSRAVSGDMLGKYPQDADANGAFHIAMKCLYLVHEVVLKSDKKSEELKSADLKVDLKDWLGYMQARCAIECEGCQAERLVDGCTGVDSEKTANVRGGKQLTNESVLA